MHKAQVACGWAVNLLYKSIQPNQHSVYEGVQFGSLYGSPAQHSHSPFWQGPPARCPAGSWQGRKQVVVVLRNDWCDSEEASADGGCRFIVLPACGLEQALSSSSWDQGPASKLQQGLYGSASRQKDAFLTREHPIFVFRCEVIQCWILRGSLAILLFYWKQRAQGELSLMLHHCGLGKGWQWTRH